MSRAAAASLVLALLLTAAPQAQAASNPVINVGIFGIELCPQSICGAARFTGAFVGRVGNFRLVVGVFDVAINHEPLPEPGESRAITGGEWSLTAVRAKFRGSVAGGTLLNNGDGTYGVAARLLIQQGGTGDLNFVGTLNHNTIIPTVAGALSQ